MTTSCGKKHSVKDREKGHRFTKDFGGKRRISNGEFHGETGIYSNSPLSEKGW